MKPRPEMREKLKSLLLVTVIGAYLAAVFGPVLVKSYQGWLRERMYAENDRLEQIAGTNFAENKDHVLTIYDEFKDACQFTLYHRPSGVWAGNEPIAKRWESLRELWRPFLTDPKALTEDTLGSLMVAKKTIQADEGPIDPDRALGVYYRMISPMPLPKPGSSHIERLAIYKDFQSPTGEPR